MSPEMTTMFYHSHAGSWFITILLFFISFFLAKRGKFTTQKITQMILRLFFVIMVITGLGLLISYQFGLIWIVKAILALGLIYLMEMILGSFKKGGEAKSLWLPFFLVLFLVLLIGFNVISF